MDLTNLLKYQELDEKLYQVEQKLKNSPAKKRASELSKVAKNAQVKSNELEEEATKALKEIEDVKEKFEQNRKSLQTLVSKELDNLSMEELDKMSSLKQKILSNLNFLEKHLQKLAELINRILIDFNKTKKMYDTARVQFMECKTKIDEETKTLEPEKARLEKELEDLSKSVEKNLLSEYKKRRNDNIFPVIVPLEGTNFCGRCRMELPMVAISRIKDVGVITCEHCKRLVYKK